MSMYLMEDGTTKPHDVKIIELTKQRDDWKAKYLQQNKDLGCELRDPNGTIWDHAKEIEGKLAKANARMAEMIHIDELRAKASAIGYKQEYWRDGLGAINCSPCMELRSPVDICLKKTSTWVDFDPTKDVLDYGPKNHQIQVNIEHRAWVCPFCAQSTEYWVVNGMTVLGCGMASLYSKGKSSDCCGSWSCRDKQEKFHQEND